MTPTEATTTLAQVAAIIKAAQQRDATSTGTKYAELRDYLIAIIERDAAKEGF